MYLLKILLQVYGKSKFIAIIHEDTYMYRVRYGGKKACVNFSVYKEEERQRRVRGMSIQEYPNLDGVGWSAECSIGSPLENGDGTQTMVKSALCFLVWRFPIIKHVQFIDASKKTCKFNISIDLATFHFSKHGKTWYEDKFDAKLINKNQQKYIDRANVSLDTKHEKDFNGFLESTRFEIRRKYKESPYRGSPRYACRKLG